MKRISPVVIASAAVGVLGLLCVALFLLFGGNGRYRGGEDTPYPYEWVEKSGKVVLTLTHAPEGLDWSCDASDGDVFSVSRKGDSFTATPLTEDSAILRFPLSDAIEPEDVRAMVELAVRAEGKTVTVTGHRIELRDAMARGGEELNSPYRIVSDADGRLRVAIGGEGGAADWSVLLHRAGVAEAMTAEAAEGEYAAILYGIDEGETDVTLLCTDKNLRLDLRLSCDTSLRLTLLSHEMKRQEPSDSEARALAEAAAGYLILPEGAEEPAFGTASLSGGTAAHVTWTGDGCEWELYAAEGFRPADSFTLDVMPASHRIPVGNTEAVCRGSAGIQAADWTEKNGRACVLLRIREAEDPDAAMKDEDLLALAEAVTALIRQENG